MTKADLGVALLLLLMFLSLGVYDWLGPLRKHKRASDRYRLFAVRDKLVFLVAEGRINEEDAVFQYLYISINKMIPRSELLTLRSLVSALKSSSLSQIFDEHSRQQFLDCINHSDRQVRTVAREFFRTIAEILIERSFFVRAFLFLSGFALVGFRVFTWTRRLLSRLFQTEAEAYDIYRNLDRASKDLALA